MKLSTIMLVALLSLTACNKNMSGTTASQNQGAPASTPTITNTSTSVLGTSCVAFGDYADLATCRTSTYANCLPAPRNINGVATTCYSPVSGWQQCYSHPASWTSGTWEPWCRTSPSMIGGGMSSGTFTRNRSVTCTKSISACDCILTPPVAIETCTGTPSTCTGTASVAAVCGAAPTPTPTATPPAKCNEAIVEFSGNDTGYVKKVYNEKWVSTIRPFLNSRNFNFTQDFLRSTYGNIGFDSSSTMPAITQYDRDTRWVITLDFQVSKSCVLGKVKGVFKISIKKNGTYAAYTALGHHADTCESISSVLSGMLISQVPSCY